MAVAGDSVSLTAVSGSPPAQLFAATLTLTVETGGAEGLVVDDDGAVLRGRFLPLEGDALAAGVFAGSVAAGSGGPVVTLPAAREVRSVHLAGAGRADARLDLFRVDAGAFASTPAASAQNGAALPEHPDELVAQRFGVKAFAAGGAAIAIGPQDIDHVQVRGRPASPQILLAGPFGGAPLPLWSAAGELGGAAPASLGGVDAGAALAGALRALLDPLPPGAGATLALTLLLSSSAPCRFVLDADLDVAARLVTRSFAGGHAGADKVSLRFRAADTSAQAVELALAEGAQVHAAALETSETFAAARPADVGAGSPEAPPQLAAGVRVAAGERAAAQLAVPAAVDATGAAVALLALAEDTAIRLELQSDAGGAPSGAVLAAGEARAASPGEQAWLRLGLRPTALLPAQPVWLVLSVAGGAAIWLAAAGAARVLRSAAGAGWGAAGAVERLVVAARLLSPDPRPAGALMAPFGVELAGTPLPVPDADADGRRSFDLTAPLAAAAGRGERLVPVTIAAVADGTVTLGGPRIEYTLPG